LDTCLVCLRGRADRRRIARVLHRGNHTCTRTFCASSAWCAGSRSIRAWGTCSWRPCSHNSLRSCQQAGHQQQLGLLFWHIWCNGYALPEEHCGPAASALIQAFIGNCTGNYVRTTISPGTLHLTSTSRPEVARQHGHLETDAARCCKCGAARNEETAA
jgi:hypothetical protein